MALSEGFSSDSNVMSLLFLISFLKTFWWSEKSERREVISLIFLGWGWENREMLLLDLAGSFLSKERTRLFSDETGLISWGIEYYSVDFLAGFD